MSGFSAEWLALRESHDLRARNPDVLDAVAASFKSLDTISVVDLACGAGSTVRALSSHLPARQRWDLVDNDHRLLTLACSGNACRRGQAECRSTRSQRQFRSRARRHKRPDHDLGAARSRLRSLAGSFCARDVAARALPVYAALTYDGRIDLSPADPLDAAIMSAVNAHQRTDKGFGPALGPSAAAAAISRFEALGYSVAARHLRLGDRNGRPGDPDRIAWRMGRRRE